MNVVKCCCISYNQLFQTSFVATLSEPGTIQNLRSFPNTSNPAVPKATQRFPKPCHPKICFRTSGALPRETPKPLHLNWNPQPDASLKTSYSQSFHLAIGNHGQFLKLESQPTERGAPSGKIHPSFSGRLPCIFWSAVRWCILWIFHFPVDMKSSLKKGNLSNTLLYGGKIIYDLVSYDLVDAYHMWKNLSNTSWAMFH